LSDGAADPASLLRRAQAIERARESPYNYFSGRLKTPPEEETRIRSELEIIKQDYAAKRTFTTTWVPFYLPSGKVAVKVGNEDVRVFEDKKDYPAMDYALDFCARNRPVRDDSPKPNQWENLFPSDRSQPLSTGNPLEVFGLVGYDSGGEQAARDRVRARLEARKRQEPKPKSKPKRDPLERVYRKFNLE